jgi:hypothetical protein
MTPERVAGISDAVLRSLNARNISSLLGVSVPQAKRVVNLSSFAISTARTSLALFLLI